MDYYRRLVFRRGRGCRIRNLSGQPARETKASAATEIDGTNQQLAGLRIIRRGKWGSAMKALKDVLVGETVVIHGVKHEVEAFVKRSKDVELVFTDGDGIIDEPEATVDVILK